MIRSLAFTAALWGTARVAALPPLALRLCRRIAPPELRHMVEPRDPDTELVQLVDAAIALQRRIEAAEATRTDTMRTRNAAEAFTRQAIDPLRVRQLLLVERANQLRARTLSGHRARARMAAAWGSVTDASPPCLRALVRDLIEVAA